MTSLVLITIYSALHVIAQCCARFLLFARSKQNRLNKTSFPLKWEQFQVLSRTVRFEFHFAQTSTHLSSFELSHIYSYHFFLQFQYNLNNFYKIMKANGEYDFVCLSLSCMLNCMTFIIGLATDFNKK